MTQTHGVYNRLSLDEALKHQRAAEVETQGWPEEEGAGSQRILDDLHQRHHDCPIALSDLECNVLYVRENVRHVIQGLTG